MPNIDLISQLNEEDCTRLIVDYLLWKMQNPSSTIYGTEYGYDLYLPNLMNKWLKESALTFGIDANQTSYYLPQASPRFYSSAWELCRRGILRPGIRMHGQQSTGDESGYSITPFGKQWLLESDREIFIPTEPGRFSEMISPYERIFGPGFHERANEAIRCYGAHAYLSCCVMCGAAAESILLHLAITKNGNEEDMLKKYKAANGRKTIENIIIGQQPKTIKQDFEACLNLLKYWRDEAAHGRRSNIIENEAYTSLVLLLRCAQFAKDNYQTLTGQQL